MDQMFVVFYWYDKDVLHGSNVVVYWYDRGVLHGSNVCCSLLL